MIDANDYVYDNVWDKWINTCFRGEDLLWAQHMLCKRGYTWQQAKRILYTHYNTPQRMTLLQNSLFALERHPGEKIQEFGDQFMNIAHAMAKFLEKVIRKLLEIKMNA